MEIRTTENHRPANRTNLEIRWSDGKLMQIWRPGDRDYQDWYFFAYAKDYKRALNDFRLLSGPAPLPTHKSLGIIFSRWPAFSEEEIVSMAETFRREGYPLATLVMDMEWHKEGWGYWEFNPELIPDPQAFFALCRKYDLEVTFNDHPLDVREDDCHYPAYVAAAGPTVDIRERNYNDKRLKMAKVDICEKRQNQAFRETCHKHIMDLGLDYWWNDGSRGQMAGTCGQLVCNKTFFEESERDGKRGMPMQTTGAAGRFRIDVPPIAADQAVEVTIGKGGGASWRVSVKPLIFRKQAIKKVALTSSASTASPVEVRAVRM